jgi:hypothetical protein
MYIKCSHESIGGSASKMYQDRLDSYTGYVFWFGGGVCFLSRGQLCFLFDHDLKKKSPVKRKKVVMSPMFFESMHKKYVFQSWIIEL